MVLAFAAIGVRLFDLQARDRSHLVSLGLGQRVRTVTIPAERGNIFDRTGKVLAVSVPQTTIVADPRVIKDPAAYAAKLAPIVQVDQAQLEQRLSNRKSAFAYVAAQGQRRDVTRQVRKLDLIGISYQDESRRFYPNGTIAAPVVGFVGTDNNGLGGMEYAYDKMLTGKPGSVQVERDPQGNDIPGVSARCRPRSAGQDLVLTIDSSLQWNTEQALTQGVQAMNAKGGIAVIVDVQTGDVLAMASVDGATDQHPATTAPSTASNRPITDVYEPGSTNKVITMAGGDPGRAGDARHRRSTTSTQSVNVGGDRLRGRGRAPDHDDGRRHPRPVVERRARSRSRTELGATNAVATTSTPSASGSRPGSTCPASRRAPPSTMKDYTDTSMGSMPIGYGIAVTADADARRLHDHRQPRDGPPAAAGRRRRSAPTASATTRRCPRRTRWCRPATADAVTSMLKKVVSDRGHRHQGPDPRLPGGRQDRHRPQGALQHRRVQRVVRRVRAGRQRRGWRRSSCSTQPRAASSVATSPRRCSSRSCRYALAYERVPTTTAMTRTGPVPPCSVAAQGDRYSDRFP